MEEYTIYCTEEQTKKALELGAQIKTNWIPEYLLFAIDKPKVKINNEWFSLKIPTAEQMIGWLEDGKFREINVQEFGNFWEYNLYTYSGNTISRKGNYTGNYTSRPEATLDAIDAALEYLEGQKNIH